MLRSILKLLYTVVIALCLFYAGLWLVFFGQSLLSSSRTVTLNFPEKVILGELHLIEDWNCFTCSNGSTELGKAHGQIEVTLPTSRWYIELQMRTRISHLIPHLSKDNSLQQIESIDMNSSNITDEDLSYLKQFKLGKINLSNTRITGSGLSYLQPHPDWTYVDVSCNSRLKFEHLEHFSDWQNATITVTGDCPDQKSVNSSEQSIESNKLITRAKKHICQQRSEEQCLQVR